MGKCFLGRSLCLFCLAAPQKRAHAAHSLSRLGELHGGLCFNPSSRAARLAGASSLHVNRPLHYFRELIPFPEIRFVHHCTAL